MSEPEERKPYVAPDWEEEEVFEVAASITCVQFDQTCDPGPIQS